MHSKSLRQRKTMNLHLHPDQACFWEKTEFASIEINQEDWLYRFALWFVIQARGNQRIRKVASSCRTTGKNPCIWLNTFDSCKQFQVKTTLFNDFNGHLDQATTESGRKTRGHLCFDFNYVPDVNKHVVNSIHILCFWLHTNQKGNSRNNIQHGDISCRAMLCLLRVR